MLEIKSKADLQRLVDQGLEESLTLDYKAGRQIIYGIEEEKMTAKPSRVDTELKIRK